MKYIFEYDEYQADDRYDFGWTAWFVLTAITLGVGVLLVEKFVV